VDTYLTKPISSFLNSEYSGIFGLGPKSNFWKWIRSVYLPEHETISASIHYQNTTPENDYQLKLATGKYARPSTLMINGKDGEQDMHYFKSSETDWWSYEDVGIQLLGNSTTADPDDTKNKSLDDSDDLKEKESTMVIHKLCFTNIGDNFLYVSNPGEFVKIISKQLCKKLTACDPKKIDLETEVLIMAFNKNTNTTPSSDILQPKDKVYFKFPAKDMVSYHPEGNSLVFWIGDLSEIQTSNSCPSNSTIATGKRFLRFMELSMWLDKSLKNPIFGIGRYQKYHSRLIFWIGFAVAGILTTLFLIFTFVTVLKNKNYSKHININLWALEDDNLITATKALSHFAPKSPSPAPDPTPRKLLQCKLIINFYETRIDFIHKSKYIVYSPFI
jgi:hypothetical protein